MIVKSIIILIKKRSRSHPGTTLEPGFGIFQPDLNTDLWHTVEQISVIQGEKHGLRSTIGLDFEIIETNV